MKESTREYKLTNDQL